MSDPFGKDLDNLRKHMGGGGGGGRRQNSKEDQKPRFTYIQEREVFVCKNGVAKSEDSVVRCGVHDLRKLEELRARISELLFDGKTVTKVWMDDGVPVHAINLLRDRDILYAAIDDEPFYGDTPKPKPAAIPATPASPVHEEPESQPEPKSSNSHLKPRPFYQPMAVDNEVDGTGNKQMPVSLLSKYGGVEHFIITDMLVSKPQAIPESLRPPEERIQEKKMEDPIETSIKQKRKALSNASTATALLALLQQANPNTQVEDDLARLAVPVTPGPAKAVGIVGVGNQLEETPAVQLSRKQREQQKRQQMKKKAKKKQSKQRKREQSEGAEPDNLSQTDSDSEPSAKQRRMDHTVPGAAPPPKLPDKPYIVLPATSAGSLPVYDSQKVAAAIGHQGTTSDAQCNKPVAVTRSPAPAPMANGQVPQTSSRPEPPEPSNGPGSPEHTSHSARDEDMEESSSTPPPRPAAAYILQTQAAGPRPPSAGELSDSSDEERQAVPNKRPAEAYVLQKQAAGPQPAPGGGDDSSDDDEAVPNKRPAEAYVLQKQAAGPQPAPGGGDDSSDDDELGPKPPP